MNPNLDQILSATRTTLAAVGGYAIGRGWINEEQLTLITGIVVAIVPLIWGVLAHTDSAKIASVEALPDVKKIVVNPTADDGVRDALNDFSRPKVVLDQGVK